MAAITLTVEAVSKKATLSATPNTMQEFIVPGSARRVQIESTTNSCTLIYTGGTDAAVVSAEVTRTIAADSPFWYPLPASKQTHSIWLASGTASTVVTVEIYEA